MLTPVDSLQPTAVTVCMLLQFLLDTAAVASCHGVQHSLLPGATLPVAT
jgi:hypothetical protein